MRLLRTIPGLGLLLALACLNAPTTRIRPLPLTEFPKSSSTHSTAS